MKKLLCIFVAGLIAAASFAQTGMWVGVKNIQIEKKSKKVLFSLKAEYPFSEESITADVIREWINESLGGSYTGDLKDYGAMMEYYASRAIQNYADADVEPDFGPSEETYEFKRGHETAGIITYRMNHFTYFSGAAHGMDLDLSITFRKKDGRRFGWDMFTGEALARLKPIIANRLRVNYGEDTFFKVPRAEDPEFALPEMAPYISADGVVFTYPPYEIAPFAAGFITVTLPLTMVKSMLNATGQSFISAL